MHSAVCSICFYFQYHPTSARTFLCSVASSVPVASTNNARVILKGHHEYKDELRFQNITSEILPEKSQFEIGKTLKRNKDHDILL